MVEMRLLQVGEEEAFIKLKQEALVNAPDFLTEKSYNPPIEFVRNQITSPHTETKNFVLVIDGEMTGICQANLFPIRRHAAYTKTLYVRRNEKTIGQRYGTKLLQALLDYLKSIGIETVAGGTVDGNTVMEKILTELNYYKTYRDPYYLKNDANKYVGVTYWHMDLNIQQN